MPLSTAPASHIVSLISAALPCPQASRNDMINPMAATPSLPKIITEAIMAIKASAFKNDRSRSKRISHSSWEASFWNHASSPGSWSWESWFVDSRKVWINSRNFWSLVGFERSNSSDMTIAIAVTSRGACPSMTGKFWSRGCRRGASIADQAFVIWTRPR